MTVKVYETCPKCGHSMANHGTTGNTKGICLVPLCNCGIVYKTCRGCHHHYFDGYSYGQCKRDGTRAHPDDCNESKPIH